jgi:hypothetical protein
MNYRQHRRGFTMLELQVALILLTFGFVTLSSLMMSQTRVTKKVQGDFTPGAKLYLTQSVDPWVRQMDIPARISATELNLTAPTPVSNPLNEVKILSQQNGLTDESITLSVQLHPTN